MILLVKNLQKQNSKDAGIKYVLYTAEQYTANLSFYFQKVSQFPYLNPFLKQLPKHKIQVLLRENET